MSAGPKVHKARLSLLEHPVEIPGPPLSMGIDGDGYAAVWYLAYDAPQPHTVEWRPTGAEVPGGAPWVYFGTATIEYPHGNFVLHAWYRHGGL